MIKYVHMIYHLALTAMNVRIMSDCTIGVPFQVRVLCLVYDEWVSYGAAVASFPPSRAGGIRCTLCTSNRIPE